MLELEITNIFDDIIEAIIYINCEKSSVYHVTFSIGEKVQVLDSDLPSEYGSYRSHAKTALKRCNKQDLYVGKHIVSAWY